MLFLNHITLVAAADWWEILAGIIFFVLYGLGQLMGGREEGKKKAQRPPRPPRPQPEQQPFGQPDVAKAPPNQADPLRAEVEEFLRRAQGKQAEPRRPVQTAPPPRQRPPQRPPSEPANRPGQPARHPQRPPERTPEPEPVVLRVEGVAEHVARSVSTADVTENTNKLGAEVALADDKLESHLQQTFQHPIGKLQHREEAEQKLQAPTIAEEIRQLIRQPAGMRQLIIAGEILRRPEERW
jgi:hypothetical protein